MVVVTNQALLFKHICKVCIICWDERRLWVGGSPQCGRWDLERAGFLEMKLPVGLPGDWVMEIQPRHGQHSGEMGVLLVMLCL